MLFNGIKLVEGSELQNLTVNYGNAFPTLVKAGELFYRTDGANEALYIHSGTTWIRIEDQRTSISFTPVNKAGDVMTGHLTLSGDPTLAMHAATKQYVDNLKPTWATLDGKPTTIAGYGITDAQQKDADLTAIANLATAGIVVRTGNGTAATREIAGVAGSIVVVNGNGVSGSPTLNLATVGTPGTYAQVFTDEFGRVTGGVATLQWSQLTNRPTTLAGYGISDAQQKDGDLTAISALTGTGLLKRTGGDLWELTDVIDCGTF